MCKTKGFLALYIVSKRKERVKEENKVKKKKRIKRNP